MQNTCFNRLIIMLLIIVTGSLGAQSLRDNTMGKTQDDKLPIKRIAIFSSGLAYYEHSGTLSGSTVFSLPVKTAAVNDALKSLVVNDPSSVNPSVSYQSEQTLYQTLKSLGIDLSGEPDTARILASLRGAEVEISAPTAVTGRILGIEYRSYGNPQTGVVTEPWLSLYTNQGIKLFSLREIGAVNFKDPKLNSDLGRALDLISASRQTDTRDLEISLPGTSSRLVTLSYVIPAPVWKVSYRLDLGSTEAAGSSETAGRPNAAAAEKPLFQGWAIVDNDSDTDWNNVTLSLVSGRPVSFIQNLYPPYYLFRPVLPLAIAGTASAESHDSGYSMPAPAAAQMAPSSARARVSEMASMKSMAEMEDVYDSEVDEYAVNIRGGAMETAEGRAAGDQFEFTVRNPVSLDRRMSAMLPLVEANIEARKTLIFSGSSPFGVNINPRLGAELTNTSGMKLPAGPITVYDGGTYAGDALIEFWNEDEKRLISFGEDLSVTGTSSQTSAREVNTVTVSGGIMTINRRQNFIKTYTFKNNGSQSKNLLIEHPKIQGAELESPEADEQTPSAYRFTVILPAGRELLVTVHETLPVAERISLLSLRPDAFLSYSTNQEIPQIVRTALEQAIQLKRAADNAQTEVTNIQNRLNSLYTEQDRIRKNLEAAGNQTQQGQEYLKRLVSLDADIDKRADELEAARIKAKASQEAYEMYLNGLKL